MDVSKIGYTTCISEAYVSALRACEDYEALKTMLQAWRNLAYDGLNQVLDPGFSWEEYKAGLDSENRGEFAGEAWANKYGAILLPDLLLQIGLFSTHYKAPEGTVFIRLREMKIIKKRRRAGYFYMEKPKGAEK